MELPESDLVAAVRELARDRFAARAERHDREGSFPAENIAELKALRIPAMGLPREVGGLGVSHSTHLRVVEEVAYGDGSTAVALNMHLLGVEALLGLPPFPRRNAIIEDVAKNMALVCGPISVPSGELDSRTSGLVVTVEGETLRVSGRVGFASMSEGATYVTAVGTIDHGDAAEPDFVLMAPRIDSPGLRVLHNWDALGLRATASHDIAFDGVAIPKGEALVAPISMVRMLVAAASANPAIAAQRARGVLGICATWLGLAQAAFDFTVDYVKQRHGFLAGATPLIGVAGYRAADPWAQFGIGEMDHWLETGRTVLYDMAARLAGPFPSTLDYTRAMVRTIYHCRRMSEEVAAGAMRVCGAHAYVRSRSLERIYRDMTGSNVMAWKTDLLRQTLGQGALGLPIQVGGPSPA